MATIFTLCSHRHAPFRLLFFACLAAFVNHTKSQTYFFDNYSSAQGLESSKIFAVKQTSDNYIWLGTKVGASKFDGFSFINYNIDHGLSPGGVRIIFEDKNGIIWFGHEGGGISRYNGQYFEQAHFTATIPDLNITAIIQGSEENLWVCTSMDGAYCITNPAERVDSLEILHYKGRDLSDRIFNAHKTSDSTCYFVTDVGIKRFNPIEKTFETFHPKGLDTYFSFSVLFEDSKKNLWFGTYNGGVYKMENHSGKFIYYDIKHGLASNWITSFTEDIFGNIWIGHWVHYDGGGLTRIDPAGGLKVFNTENGLSDNKVFSVEADMEGNVLAGTTEHGLDIFKGEQFISFTARDGIVNNQVTAITQDKKGRVWLGTLGGISVYDPKKKTMIPYTQEKTHISNQILFLKTDAEGDVWIGTGDQGVIFWDSRKECFEYLNLINRNIPVSGNQLVVTALETDASMNIWTGTLDGLLCFDKNKQTVKRYSRQEGLPGNHITALWAGPEGKFWAGSKGKGLSVLRNDRFYPYKPFGEITPSCITGHGNDNLLVGTEIFGVYLLGDTVQKKITMQEGLLSNHINFIVSDALNNIYVGTNLGLNRVLSGLDHIITFSRRSGFTGIETKSNAAFRDREGNLWFGTVGGAFLHNPHKIAGLRKEPLTRITGMMVNFRQHPFDRKLRLSHTEKQISFQWSSICLADPEAVRYRIRLIGWESDWNNMGTQHSILYSLPPNDYQFQVIARNNMGIWNSRPETVSFTILAPFYRRAWFIVLMSILAVVAIVLYIKIRERNLRQEKRVLETKVTERTLALSEANNLLAMKNKDITDSINYARRIQFSILPPEIPFDRTFVLFKPKDIVSGDFYWMIKHADLEFIAAVDCTGHGVPGAFMSFIGYTLLNKIVIENGIFEPARILDKLNEEVGVALHQKGENGVNDGMDLALISYNPQQAVIQYAGAYNPLWLIRKGELFETRADRFAIGRTTTKSSAFTNHKVAILPGDTVYLFTDGFSDQFGGPEGKKFKTSNFKSFLLSVEALIIEEQFSAIDTRFETWKGNNGQIDDVLVIGRRF